MKRFVKLCAASVLAVAVFSGMANADAPAKKRKPTLFEQIFGNPSNGERKASRRRWRDTDETGSILAGQAKKGADLAPAVRIDEDPESDPGLGMGNLRYAAPRLVPVNGAKLDAPRPMDATAGAIFDQLLGTSGPALAVLPATRKAVIETYVSRNFQPVWLEGTSLSARGKAVLALLAAAAEEGLDPAAYLPAGLPSFDAPLPEQDAAAMARLDIDLFAAALRYSRDASGGVFDPRKLSRYNDVTPPWVEPAQAARVLAFTPYAAEYLTGLHPTHPAYAAFKAELAALRADATAGQTTLIPDGPIVKAGGTDERIPAVREKLLERGYADAALEPGANPLLLDQEMSVQLRLFQKASRIRVTGALGPQTVAALNTDFTARDAAKIVDNMERLRWLPRELGRRHVFVNQPAFEAHVVEDGRDVWSTRVIVGKPNTQTSAFHDEMELVVFNPSWGVPPSIIANEYLPKLRRDPGYLDRLGFKVVTQQGKVVPSRSINWSSYGNKVPFGIQQPPGDDNALGEIKFLFPNSHNIYMHDTPSRELFEKDVRAFSHGCVRVQNPRDFAAVLLRWQQDEVAARIATPKSETVRLKEKIPVHLTYFTAWPDETGKIRFFDDIYGRDRAMEDARSTIALAQR